MAFPAPQGHVSHGARSSRGRVMNMNLTVGRQIGDEAVNAQFGATPIRFFENPELLWLETA